MQKTDTQHDIEIARDWTEQVRKQLDETLAKTTNTHVITLDRRAAAHILSLLTRIQITLDLADGEIAGLTAQLESAPIASNA